MKSFLELVQTENFMMSIVVLNIVLLIVVIALIIIVLNMNKKYLKFMKKIGKGNNLDEMLKEYLKDVAEIKKDNSEIKAYYTKLDYDIGSSIQKVGLVRYNAFQNVGSDLSFTLALLDRENNGVVLNGLYGSESSNIYAKPIKNGESTYQLSEEEKEAIEIASQSKSFAAKHKENKF
jgi:ABC-type Na+ efflux pump permease subunit